MPPRRVICKFFAQGTCLKGEYCHYSHDWRDQSNSVCTFYQKGICLYGDFCKFDHIKVSRHQPFASSSSRSGPSLASSSQRVTHPSMISWDGDLDQSLGNRRVISASSQSSSKNTNPTRPRKFLISSSSDDGSNHSPVYVKPADRTLCVLAAAGDCPHGDLCYLIHGDKCPICKKHCLHPYRPEEREEHIKKCKENKHLEALKQSQEIECCICLENVLSKPTEAERKFGLLSECDHPFCISCIRHWRSNSPSSGMNVNTAVRACPVCRKHSYFVVPSATWFSTEEEKQEIISNYKNKLKSIDCKYFDFGNGTCPFGSICFYKHTHEPFASRRSNNRHRNRAPRPRTTQPRQSTTEEEPENFVSHLAFDEVLADFAEHLLLEGGYDDYDYEDYDDSTDPLHEDYMNDEDLASYLSMHLFLSQLGDDGSSTSSADDNE